MYMFSRNLTSMRTVFGKEKQNKPKHLKGKIGVQASMFHFFDKLINNEILLKPVPTTSPKLVQPTLIFQGEKEYKY